MLSSSDVFTRCIGILLPEYFDPEIRPIVKFIHSYFSKYNTVPKVDYINAEYDCNLKQVKMDAVDVKFTCDQIELFCRQEALYNAIMESGPDVTSGKSENFGKVLERVQKALSVSIQKDLGIDMYENIQKRLETYTQTEIYEPTGINVLDEALGGGLARRQVTMFSANSGGGKSLMLSNLGANYSKRGFRVLQLALELTEQMIDLRNISILTGIKASEWKSNISEIVGTMKQHKEAGAGSFILKRIPGGSTANDIRSYLKLYESEYNAPPDVLIVDYLDLMSPNSGVKNKGIFEQDKEKSEQLAEIAFDYNAIVITASQQNRDGVRNTNPDHAIIAGGISKINTVDNYISIYMNPEMRLKGEMFLYYLKTRSSSAVGSMSQLAFNPENLIISDKKATTSSIIEAIKNRKRQRDEKLTLPGIDNQDIEVPDEYAEAIFRYHEAQDDNYDNIEKNEEIDLSDDSQLWEKKPKFKLTATDDHDDLISLIGEL